jgi:hypothetical protein
VSSQEPSLIVHKIEMGDLVRILPGAPSHGHPFGTIGEIIEVDNSHIPYKVFANNRFCWYKAENVALYKKVRITLRICN